MSSDRLHWRGEMYERCVVGDSCRQVGLEERGIERLRWRRWVERDRVGGER